MSRHSPGEIRDAIFSALRQTGGKASLSQIKTLVSEQLEAVPDSSIRSYLQINTPDIFERVSRGTYRLRTVAEPAVEYEITPPTVQVGQAELVQADCFPWLQAREPNSIHAVVTDPPYGLVEYSPTQKEKLRNGKGGVWRIPPAFDGHQRSPLPRFTTLTREQLDDLHGFFVKWACLLGRVLVPGAHVFVASNPLVSYLVSHALVIGGLERRGEIIRLVMTMRGGDRPKNAHEEFPDVTVMPRSMWEPWLLFRRPLQGRVQDNLRVWRTGGLRRISATKPFGDVIRSGPTRPTEKKLAPHPSLKPQAFLRRIVRAALPLGEGVVLDPFAGSGSTLAAANHVGYESIGVELDPDYYRLALEAIPKLATFDPTVSEPDTPSLF